MEQDNLAILLKYFWVGDRDVIILYLIRQIPSLCGLDKISIKLFLGFIIILIWPGGHEIW